MYFVLAAVKQLKIFTFVGRGELCINKAAFESMSDFLFQLSKSHTQYMYADKSTQLKSHLQTQQTHTQTLTQVENTNPTRR